MSTDPVQDFYRVLFELIESIEDCLAKGRRVSSLILLYAGIDSIAALECEPEKQTRADFIAWTEKYMLKGNDLKCSAVDLYAARCGILHGLMADSDLSRMGKAQRVFYAWGDAKSEPLNELSNKLGLRGNVCINIRDLIDAFRIGMADYIEDVTSDEARQANFLGSLRSWFANMDIQKVDD